MRPKPSSAVREAQITLLRQALRDLWHLGRNLVLAWTPAGGGIDVLVIPHHRIADPPPPPEGLSAVEAGAWDGRAFIAEVIAAPKRVSAARLAEIARLVKAEPRHIALALLDIDGVGEDTVDMVVRTYGISYAEDRAVALFDIVGFSRYTPLEQVTQLNSLAHSANAAHAKMLSKKLDINFARSTTGDGFYVWNRDRSVQANVNLYHFMHLVMADNAIARSKSTSNATPLLRTCFHVGGHYEFYQSESLSPTIYSYIVGDVTIELARMIEKARPGQVLVGDFEIPIVDSETGQMRKIDTIGFIERTQSTLDHLKGVVMSGDNVESIKCYLTGDRAEDGSFRIKKYRITDKHGFTRNAYNAKINIYRTKAEPIFLGVQDQALAEFEEVAEMIPIR